MKSDAELQKDVMDEFAWDPAVPHESIGVAVKDGVVTVSGHLDTFAEKAAVERALHRVAGMRARALDLVVRLAPQHRRDDTDIAAAAERALRWNTMVPADRVCVSVEDGWLTLSGEADWDYQRRAAYKAVHALQGVVGIANEIVIRRRPVPADVSERIAIALARHAALEAHKVEVEVKESTARLRGKVHSWSERKAVEGAAYSAPGVRFVVNELEFGG